MGGPWGTVPDVLISLFPIAVLVTITLWLKLPSRVTVPLSAFLMWIVRTAYFGHPANLINAFVLQGLLDALTPLSIVWGAILLFRAAHYTKCLQWMTAMLKQLSRGNVVAEVFLIGWAFVFLVEGASGFGTPVALASPILVQMGHDAVPSIAVCLIMDCLMTPHGAVGTPIWFGLGGLPGIGEDQLLAVSLKVALINGIAAPLIAPLACRILAPWDVIRRNAVFMYLSIASCIVPSILLAIFSYEFSALLGGFIGLCITVGLVYKKIGMDTTSHSDHTNHADSEQKQGETGVTEDVENRQRGIEMQPLDSTQQQDSAAVERPSASETAQTAPVATESEDDAILKEARRGHLVREALLHTMPFWGTVLILIFTRVRQIKLNEVLTETDPHFSVHLGSLATFTMSPSFVIGFEDILGEPPINSDGETVSWRFALLHVPFLLPFVAVSALTLYIFRDRLGPEPGAWKQPFREATKQLAHPAQALFGALVLVSLLRRGRSGVAGLPDVDVPAIIIGGSFADWLGKAWVIFAAPLGSLGAFFSGSTTVSNLTFAPIQLVVAEELGQSVTSMLALQCVGGAIGNAICIHNIIATKAVMGLDDKHYPDAAFIMRTIAVQVFYSALVLVMGVILLFGID